MRAGGGGSGFARSVRHEAAESGSRENSAALAGGPRRPVSAAEQPLEPAQEPTSLAGSGRCRRRSAGRGLRSRNRLRLAGRWRLWRRRSGFCRLGSASGSSTRPRCLLHLLMVATQDGIRRHTAGCLLHLLVVPAQNGICRYLAHNRLLDGKRTEHCNEKSRLSPEGQERRTALTSAIGRSRQPAVGLARRNASSAQCVATAISSSRRRYHRVSVPRPGRQGPALPCKSPVSP